MGQLGLIGILSCNINWRREQDYCCCVDHLVDWRVGLWNDGVHDTVAADHPKSWHKHLGYVMSALREIPNETTHVPPALLAFSRVPRGPLAIINETWCGEREFPPELGNGPLEYLKGLQQRLQIAK